MQVKKRRYWPRGKPEGDFLQSLGPIFGAQHVLRLPNEGMYVALLRDRQPKAIIANCGTTTRVTEEISKWIDGKRVTMPRPNVFYEYGQHKGSQKHERHSES